MMLGKHSTNWAKFSALSFICPIKASYVSSSMLAPVDGLSQSSRSSQHGPKLHQHCSVQENTTQEVEVAQDNTYRLCKLKSRKKNLKVIPLVVKFTESRNKYGGFQDVGRGGNVAPVFIY